MKSYIYAVVMMEIPAKPDHALLSGFHLGISLSSPWVKPVALAASPAYYGTI